MYSIFYYVKIDLQYYLDNFFSRLLEIKTNILRE